MDQREARQQLNEAIREREAVRIVADQADAQLREAMRAAISSGVTIAEVAELTGYHRNSVRRIVDG
ncbi:hypothetical protein GCM10023201_50310 [Actinomycetospora corticicola]